jgi:hypothetical protein
MTHRDRRLVPGALRTALLLGGLVAALVSCGGESPPSSAAKKETPAPTPAADATVENPHAGPFRTAAQCGACHSAIYEEWKSSMHGEAMTDYLFLQLSNDADNPEECIRCHAPVPIREVDFDTPIARTDRREDAISCLSCHSMGENQVAAPHDGVSGPCNPVFDPAQTDPRKVCFGCHNQHNTGKEWLTGPYGPMASEPRKKPLTTCIECHMPEVERPIVDGGEVRKGRRHTWFGGHSLSQLQKAADIDVDVGPAPGGGYRFTVWVTNKGAGHNLPSDARHRSFDTYVKIWDENGKVILDPVAEIAPGVVDIDQQERARAATYRLFYRNSGKRDTQIAPLERVSQKEDMKGYVDVPEATKGRGEAWLVYRLTPDDALVKESVTDPEHLKFYRARVVKKVSFEYGD